ncbi:F-box/FBD/LRR-repeat protein At5g53840-like isoform X2 [Hordeum vulgare subsp. vulgare]|uniref:F-box/FBD/LRR-repeat protein At5g53840-like isoform X2 n=1 Tax=Hordeum vulgare subsp. vulgare TaxID=112509 RepID=UPI001D1A36BC|nr:F-box/FBD/LRR-repeat protein At5g53840-like isoform X2 [Hordeum vulgare subsp. vulgare]
MADGAASVVSTAGYDGDDRISALHDDLLCAIISRLSVTDAARTTTLGPRWRHLWHSTPLALDDADLHKSVRDAVVPRILADHPGPFRSVILAEVRFASLDHELAEWPSLLATKGIQILALVNKHIQSHHTSRRLPAEILRCVSLQRLLLGFWTFPVDLSRGADVIFPHLQRLNMIGNAMSDHDLEYLLAASPVLKIITLARNKLKHVHLRSQSLQCVVIGRSAVKEVAVMETPLLDRLILLEPSPSAVGSARLRIKIACAANLRVLGYLEPRAHKLQIGYEVIESLPHDPSIPGYELTGELQEYHAKFWQGVSPIKCLRSHVNRMVLHKYRGYQNEFEFLKFIAKDAPELQSLVLVPHEESFTLPDEMNEMIDRLGCPRFRAWTSKVLLVLTKVDIGFGVMTASDLTVEDPFRCSMHG